MKFLRSPRPAQSADPASSPTDRRGLVVGAGVAGVAALAATVLHRRPVALPETAGPASAAAEQGGYQVTPHVLRYYETTRS